MTIRSNSIDSTGRPRGYDQTSPYHTNKSGRQGWAAPPPGGGGGGGPWDRPIPPPGTPGDPNKPPPGTPPGGWPEPTGDPKPLETPPPQTTPPVTTPPATPPPPAPTGYGVENPDFQFYDPTQASGGGARFDQYQRDRVGAGWLDPNKIAAQREANVTAGVGPFQQGTGHIDPRYQTGGDDTWFPNDPMVGEGGTGETSTYDSRRLIDPTQFRADPFTPHSPYQPPVVEEPPPTVPDNNTGGGGGGGGGGVVAGPAGPAPVAPRAPSVREARPWSTESWQGPSTIYQAGQLPMDRLPQYNPYQITQDQIPEYQAGNINQFLAPDQSAVTQQTQGVVQDVLGNRVMSDQMVGQMREQQKEQALAQQEQMLQQMGAGAAARGTYGGGRQLGREADIRQGTSDQLLRGSRDLGIMQAQANRQDQLSAMQASNQFLTGQAAREGEMYRTGLAGQTSQEALNQEQAMSGLRARQLGLGREEAQGRQNLQGYQSQVDQSRDYFNRKVQQEQLQQQQAASSLQDYLGRGQMDLGQRGHMLDEDRLTETGRQFDQDLALRDFLGRGNLDISRGQLGVSQGHLGLGRDRIDLARIAQQRRDDPLSQLMAGMGGPAQTTGSNN